MAAFEEGEASWFESETGFARKFQIILIVLFVRLFFNATMFFASLSHKNSEQ